ncbi:hypothetical protein HKK55_00320 [Pseudomonas sp. ADAK18]|uniref:DUF6124 family protein n=1 Tax=Pseudomonas sp. ADAK18 TaxID=2730848 RepID=UPI0014648045|nr:DUF6124 family protein [Pseudomonas sp. ADAK18]QJI27222.1 hypothetical protein HKK55_00320 [Pseudomonas sp. ADAK18]
MKKISPNPPCTSPSGTNIFCIAKNIDTETLLVQACETLASLNAITADLAFELDGVHRYKLLATQQLSALGELLVARALDILVPTADLETVGRTAP